MKSLSLLLLLAFGFIRPAAAEESPSTLMPPVVESLPAAAQDEVGLLDLAGPIDDKSVDLTIARLKIAKDMKIHTVVIRITSEGGSVYAGFRLIRQIEAMDGVTVACLADIHAESMAFVILQSCDVRVMTKRTSLMIHEVHLGMVDSYFTAVKAENALADLKASSRAMGEYVSHRMKMPYAKFAAHVRDGRDWHMDWESALKFHAVDMVVDSLDDLVTPAAK